MAKCVGIKPGWFLLRYPNGDQWNADETLWANCQYCFAIRVKRYARPNKLFRSEGGSDWRNKSIGPGSRQEKCYGQCCGTRFCAHRHDEGFERKRIEGYSAHAALR